ncbi:MAG: hybrid sensor histidine kinase/response regulator [Saprospiraceae bacterium]|nr:hybrid sensor histidine kinase/response regulator [Saprospiraceae bacterium]
MEKTTKILVVEDELDFQRLLNQRFRKEIRAEVFQFAFAENGIAALETLAKDASFDIVMSDIRMPKMNGLVLLENLRADYPQLISIIISAYGDLPNIRTAMNLGAYDFVTKPINFTDLNITLQKAIREVETVRQAAKARELQMMNEQLRKLDQMKSQFLTNITHEFRTPLTVIQGMADQVAAKPEKWLTRGTQMIKRNSTHLLYLMEQIMDLTKLEAGALKLNLVQGDVLQHLSQVIQSFHELATQKQIQFEFTTPNDNRLVMEYDPNKLEKILSNVLSNAIKFNDRHGKVQLRLKKGPWPLTSPVPEHLSNGDFLIMEVEDTGFGIPETKLPFIYDLFYQVDGSSTRSGEGTGIGLALVKGLLALMQGTISVSSEEGKGSLFQIILPLVQHPVA